MNPFEFEKPANRKTNSQNKTAIIIAAVAGIMAVCSVVSFGLGFVVFQLNRQADNTPTSVKIEQEVKKALAANKKPVAEAKPPAPEVKPKVEAPILAVKADPPPREPVPPIVPPEKKAADLETAESLVEKGRKLMSERVRPERGFSPAQATIPNLRAAESMFVKALPLCGESREQQILKAKVYYRISLIRSNLISKTTKKAGSYEDAESQMQFAKIMREQGIMSGRELSAIRLEVMRDHSSLIRQSYGLKRDGI